MLWWPRRGEPVGEVMPAPDGGDTDETAAVRSAQVPAQRARKKPAVDQERRDRQGATARGRPSRELADAVRAGTGHSGGAGPTDSAPIELRGIPTDPIRIEGPTSDERVEPISLVRVRAALDRLEVRYLTDGEDGLLAMWERHAILIALEGPEDEILVMRTRPHSTVPPDWADRAYRVVNEWNHSRRFCKAYIGDPTDRGQLPIYAEVQVPLISGVHDALLAELLDCGVSVSLGFVEWLHDEGCLL